MREAAHMALFDVEDRDIKTVYALMDEIQIAEMIEVDCHFHNSS